jgi:hypothetical protein
VSNTRGLRGCAGGRNSRRGADVARSTAGDKAPPNLLSRTELAASKGSSSSNRVSRAVIIRSFGFEEAQYSIGAVRCPRRNDATISFAQSL